MIVLYVLVFWCLLSVSLVTGVIAYRRAIDARYSWAKAASIALTCALLGFLIAPLTLWIELKDPAP